MILSSPKQTSSGTRGHSRSHVLKECADKLVTPLYILFRASVPAGELTSGLESCYTHSPIKKKRFRSDVTCQ